MIAIPFCSSASESSVYPHGEKAYSSEISAMAEDEGDPLYTLWFWFLFYEECSCASVPTEVRRGNEIPLELELWTFVSHDIGVRN